MQVCRGSARGLARLEPSRCTVAAKGTQRRKNVQWDGTEVAYVGLQNTGRRRAELCRLGKQASLPWLCIGLVSTRRALRNSL